MEEYKSIFLSLDKDNSGQIETEKLKESLEKEGVDGRFSTFMDEELDRIKTKTIDFKTYQGK